MTPRTVLILCERAPVKTNLVPAMREAPMTLADVKYPTWTCSYCGRRVQVVA